MSRTQKEKQQFRFAKLGCRQNLVYACLQRTIFDGVVVRYGL